MRVLSLMGVTAILTLGGCAARLPTDEARVANLGFGASRPVAETTISVPRSLARPAGVAHHRIYVGHGSPDNALDSAVVAVAPTRPAPRPTPTPARPVVRSRTVQTAMASPVSRPRTTPAPSQANVRRLFTTQPEPVTTGGCVGGT